MLDYLIAPLIELFVISVASSLVLYICNNSPFLKTIKFLCALFMFTVVFNILSPIFGAISSLGFKSESSLPDYDATEYENEVIEQSANYISKYTKELICSKFNIDKTDIVVTVTLKKNAENEINIENTTVELLTEYDVRYTEIVALVNNTLLCECTLLTKEQKI